MKLGLSLLAAGLLWALPAQAAEQCYSYTLSQTNDYRRIDYDSLLWKVYAPGRADKASYVFGTYHSARPEILAKLDRLKPVLPDVKAVVFELPLSKEEVGVKVGRSMLLPKGQELKSIIGADRYQVLAHVFRRVPQMMGFVNQLKPWAAGLIASGVPQDSEAELEPGGLVLDARLEQITRSLGKTVGWLEKPEEQMAVFDGLSTPEQVAYLDMTLRQMLLEERNMGDLKHYYLHESLQGLHDLVYRQMKPETALEKKILHRLNDARNRVMMQRMNGVVYKGHILVAVGSLHLPGEQGLLHRLEKRGFCIEPQLPNTALREEGR